MTFADRNVPIYTYIYEEVNDGFVNLHIPFLDWKT